jgi:uncharacterized RDD family membrane protein YckC
MDQGKIGRGARTRISRRALPLVLAIASLFLLWFGLFIAGPWFLHNPPGPNNQSFGWYLLFEMFPLTLLTAVFLLLLAAYKLRRHEARHGADVGGSLRRPGEQGLADVDAVKSPD